MEILNNLDQEYSNIPKSVVDKLNRNLYQVKSHPLEIIKSKIFDYFKSNQIEWNIYENLNKVVSVENNFDKLLIPPTHPSRSKSDTYYLNKSQVLRTHTTAHQVELLESGLNNFLICGDVYRRDEVDSHHYNIFHQLEGVILYEQSDPINLEEKLVKLMEGLCEYLFPGSEYRVKPDYFPFTNPSYEIEVFYSNKWLEILGCGIIQPDILKNAGRENKKGIAWGLGLERLAMVLFDIPDIRYFWMEDDNFLNQFKSGQITKFIPFSPLEPIVKDISLFVLDKDLDSNNNWEKLNQFYEKIRDLTDDWVGEIKQIDSFYNKKTQTQSYCFRLIYSPKDYKITNPAEFNNIVNSIQTQVVTQLKLLDWIKIRG